MTITITRIVAVLAACTLVAMPATIGLAGCAAPVSRSVTRAITPAPRAHRSPVDAVGEVTIIVREVEDATRFYTDVLSFRVIAREDESGEAFAAAVGVPGAVARSAVLALGAERIRLRQFIRPASAPVPADARSNDRWFQHIAIVVRDMDRAYERLRSAGVRHVSAGPQTLPLSNPAAGGISAFYFNDPDGHVLEIIHFPPGKGDPRWQTPGDDLFQGVDHTAIVVADTQASLRFYEGVLGLRVAGESHNFGVEQERLNNVPGARLRITGLRAAAGPGIELLDYEAPGDGRARPTDATPSDLLAWTTTLWSSDAADLERRLRGAGATWITPGLVPASSDGAVTGLVADPDGHLLTIRSQTRGR